MDSGTRFLIYIFDILFSRLSDVIALPNGKMEKATGSLPLIWA